LFVDIGGIVDHHCLEVIICFVDVYGLVDHCLEVIVRIVDVGVLVDHHCLELRPSTSTIRTITSKQ
jgi:hypothetical protein